MESELVSKRLGARAGALYSRVCDLQRAAPPGDTPTRKALRVIVINLLCGAFHDYRSEALIPKGDLADALRELSRDAAIAQQALVLMGDVLRGAFNEDEAEGKRWARHVIDAKTEHRAVSVPSQTEGAPADIELTPRELEVFRWICRYCEVYQRPPTIREVGDGCAVHASRARQIIGQLAAKGAVQSLGGARGWIPTRTP